MRRRLLAALIGVVAAITFTATTPMPAHAQVPCPAAVVCTYQHVSYGGSMYYYSGPFNYCITIGAPWTNMISSVVNNKSIPVRLYYTGNCSYNLWNMNVPANDARSWCPELLNDHVWSIWIGFTPPG